MIEMWYRNEDGGGAKVCYVASVIISVIGCALAFYQIREIIINGSDNQKLLVFVIQIIGFAFLTYFVWRFGKVAELRAESHKKWHRYLIENGIKERGKIIEIIDHKNIGDLSAERYYTFLISYYSHFYDEIRKFETTALAFIPDEHREYVCNVYEAQGWMIENGNKERDIYQNYYSVNPFRTLKRVEENNDKLLYGYVVADNFEMIENKCLPPESNE